ncbi:alpha-amylase family glycosyl hydrolase [Rufibacter latericius]|uniref:T9SS C-terminal target domain-containing protein n=1 Tax=Rufibacter latericius TaxID=2487040 RepID=A0A3M9MTU8_9BACT|nr:alpha-amylase family glycosyl hydrolase [Rufibacter latericius]RNI28954.1 T9SS C-terminal target domain-containing protein [Rufibacter latericius]
MKRIYPCLLFVLAPLYGAMAQQVQLTLRVNMSQQTVSPNGVHVAGNFQALAGGASDWNPATLALTDLDKDGTYETTVTLPTGGLFHYKFINGNSWAGAEIVPGACGLNDGAGNFNRTVDATAAVTRTPSYFFGTCETNEVTVPQTDYSTYWWNDAVFYEVFVRSFKDSNGDGKGDFRGLMEKLDYLNDGNPNTNTDLGVTALWLMPMMESPSYHGYDVTNYYATEPDYGTMAEFEAFLDAAHARGIKVIIDFVMNHSSDQHPWFTQSSSNTTNTYRNWYIWSDTHPGFTGPVGQNVWHQKNGKYYYGIFYSGMPDLNWSNAQLKSTMWDVTRFWLNKGVDGYRIDAVKYLDENGSTVENTPETLELFHEFHDVVKTAKADAFTIGEAWSNTAAVVPYVQNNRLDVAFEFDLASSILSSVRDNNPTGLRNQLSLVNRVYPKLQYGTFLTNHDQNRVMGELGSNLAHMKQAAALYLTMPGVPFLYYGEEVGMLGSGVDEDKRKPMQWTQGANAGFTTGSPWRAVNSNFAQFNVQTMESDPASLLNHYKKLIRIRQAQPSLRKGYHQDVTSANSSVLSYARVFEREAVVVVSNFGSAAVSSPVLSMAVSSLPAGSYSVQDLYSNQNMGTVTINGQGAFSNWSVSGGSLNQDQTWILRLSQTTTGIADEKDSLPVQLYPNPTSGKVSLSLDMKASARGTITVYDAAGRLFKLEQMNGSTHTFDTQAWTNGIYFLKVKSGGLETMKRLVVTH